MNKELIYKSFVSFLIKEGVLDQTSELLKTKLTLQVRDPDSNGMSEFLEDTLSQMLSKMSSTDFTKLSQFIVNYYFEK